MYGNWDTTDWSIYLTIIFTFATLLVLCIGLFFSRGTKDVLLTNLKSENKRLEEQNEELRAYIKKRDDDMWAPNKTVEVAPVTRLEDIDDSQTIIFEMPITDKPKFRGKHRDM